MNDDKFLTPEELAERWKTTTGTLANLRSKGRGPEYIKALGKVLYKKDDIKKYEAGDITE